MNGSQNVRGVEIVVKISKLCNLRCRYCYEFPELGNPAAMSREQLSAMYRNIRDYFVRRDALDGVRTMVNFIWHGGEPLLQDPQRFWDTFADQEEIFGPGFLRRNSVQTNLLVLDEERQRLLADGFDSVGVSIDVVGGLRVNAAGRSQEPRVIENFDALLMRRRAGAITVLTARTLPHLPEIFRFYESRRVNFRVLGLFDTGETEQISVFSIDFEQEVAALCQVFDLWLESEHMPRPPSPLGRYLQIAVRHLADAPREQYLDRREWLPAVLVNTDGQCYTPGDPYGDLTWSLGDIFTTPLEEMFAGEGFERCVAAAERKQAMVCLNCPFFGHCDGRLLVDAEPRSRDLSLDGQLACAARPVIEHITRRLQETMPATVGPCRDLDR